MAMDPTGKISGAVAPDRVRRQMAVEPTHDRPELQRARQLRWFDEGQVIAMRRFGFGGPMRLARGLEYHCHGCEGPRASVDSQGRLIDAAKLAWIGMDMHQRLPWMRHRDQAVAGGRRFAEPAADRDQHVGVAHARGQARIGGDAEIAGKTRMAIVEPVLPAKSGAYRERESFRE